MPELTNTIRNVQLLDTNTANQIAAGEVVEKPASVVKELVENALDAGADNVEVTIYAGGTEYIRVADNGSGMTEENARLAVLRHATSKIVSANDLLTLHTLGFRGEALPSIASVSNFTLLTRPESEEFATSIHIDGGENMECSSAGGNAGTTVIVENLFFNVPARRKFLKTVSTEGRYISELLTKLALSRPDVRFKLVNSDKEVLSTSGSGDLKETIRALYGKNVADELLEVAFSDEKIKITGYIGRPTLLKGTRQWQTLFVNGRIITNRMMGKAIDHAYQSQIPKSGFPFAVLNITVDTASIDVNVHPQKSEIKFSDDSTVYKALYKAMTDALTRPMSARKTQVELLDDSELNVFKAEPVQPQQADAPKHSQTPAYEPVFKSVLGEIFKTPEPVNNGNDAAAADGAGKSAASSNGYKVTSKAGYNAPQPMWEADDKAYAAKKAPVYTINEAREEFVKNEQLNEPVEPGAVKTAPQETITFTDTDSGVDTIWPIGQVDKTFIIAQSEDALYLIDQHAAHERILYDKLVAARDNIPAQQLLMPIYIDMQAQDVTLIEEHREEFLRLGVDITAAGEEMLRISSLPTDIKADDAEEFVSEISKMLREMRDISPSDLRQEVLHMTACKAAIKAGQLLNMRQMRQLIIDLCNTTHPFTCPHGRPCMIEINSNELYKMFKRTGF